jgi:cardiolipin synthase
MSNYWENEEIFLDGDQYFARLIQDIQAAKELITVEVYIFNHDELGRKIASHLIAAYQRGVKVQIIVDGVGSLNFFEGLHQIFFKSGIKVKMFHPLPFYHPFFGRIPFRKKIQALIKRLWNLNQRNHRKIFTIDHQIMYLGSFNITAEHTSYFGEQKWKDTGVRVFGKQVGIAVLHFKRNWQLREFFRYRKMLRSQRIKDSRQSPLRLNHSLLMRRIYARDMLKRIRRSQNRIWLVTPYFIPTRSVILALAKAAKRGVDVKILISSKSDVRLSQILQYFYYPYLLKKGVKIFHYAETILHSKTFIIDSWITVGSSNLNHRSLLHDLEVDLIIQGHENQAVIVDDFKRSTPLETEITLDLLKQRTFMDQFLCRLFFIFKYWF